jgi:MerR family transcriptional regulator/heat shock protein HspR
MNVRVIPRDLVAQRLAISLRVLDRYEKLGLVRSVHDGSMEGYEPAQIRRLWTIVSFQRDLGINLAGVEVILQLIDQMSQVHLRAHHMAEEIRQLLDVNDESSSEPDSYE